MYWVIEKNTFEENEKAFTKSANVSFMKYRPFDSDNPFELISGHLPDPKDHHVIFYGSINLGRRLINLGYEWQIWLPKLVFDCNYWMPRYKEECYNKNAVIVPFGYLFEYMSQTCSGNYFVRPNSGYKLFSGGTINASSPNFEKEIIYLKNQYMIQPEDLILLSPAGSMEFEYRFVICGGDEPFISSASQYKNNFELETSSYVPKDAYDYVNELLKTVLYDPAPAWTFDICFSSGAYSVIETNSFTSAGLYDCDIAKIVVDIEKVTKEIIVK